MTEERIAFSSELNINLQKFQWPDCVPFIKPSYSLSFQSLQTFNQFSIHLSKVQLSYKLRAFVPRVNHLLLQNQIPLSITTSEADA